MDLRLHDGADALVDRRLVRVVRVKKGAARAATTAGVFQLAVVVEKGGRGLEEPGHTE